MFYPNKISLKNVLTNLSTFFKRWTNKNIKLFTRNIIWVISLTKLLSDQIRWLAHYLLGFLCSTFARLMSQLWRVIMHPWNPTCRFDGAITSHKIPIAICICVIESLRFTLFTAKSSESFCLLMQIYHHLL